MKIKYVKAREILDSKGTPTISTLLQLDDNSAAKGEVPSGASTGKTEVLELRDADLKRHRGKGVLTAVDNVNNLISKQLIGRDFKSQEEFDKFLINLDGTELKTNFGGNTILSLSMAFCRATAISKRTPLYKYFAEMYWKESYRKDLLKLPEALILVMEGGEHGNWATDFQEYMVIPQKKRFPSFSEALRAGAEIHHAIHDILVEKKYDASVGLEGGFAPTQIKSNTEAFDIIMEGIEKAGYVAGENIKIAIDIAASEFYDPTQKKYSLKRENLVLTSSKWLEFQKNIYNKYPIYSIEDPMDQEDWDGWANTMIHFGKERNIVGDDLLTTNVKRIKKAIEEKSVNAVIIKLNQIGTITETLDAIHLSNKMGWASIISHRSGETNDDMIADLVIGTSATQCKFGGTNRGERLAKYNRLLEIEEFLR